MLWWGTKVYRSIAAFWGVGLGEAVFWRSPHAALYGGIGGAQRIREVGSATSLRLGLRPKLVPPIGSSPGRMRFGFLLLCPSFFGSLWAGNQVTGVTGVTGDGGCRGWGDAVGRYNAPDRMEHAI